MTNLPRLQVSGLPAMGPEEASATSSPARGAQMINFLRTRLTQKTRMLPLVHSWTFWYEKHDRSGTSTSSSGNESISRTTPPHLMREHSDNYEEHLELLAEISDVKQFWSVFNNFDISRMQTRDSVHLFHKGVKPIWEDARNRRGGCWTFRVPRHLAGEFWTNMCMLAIGEQLQAAVEDPKRLTFRDDICGVNLSVRFKSVLVQVWTRDGDHQAAIDRIAEVVLKNMKPDLKPHEGTYYYKKHSEHSGFKSSASPVESLKQPAASKVEEDVVEASVDAPVEVPVDAPVKESEA